MEVKMERIETIIESYSQGGLSRRQFIKGLAALGLTMTTINGLLAFTAGKAQAAAPKRG